MWLDTRMTTTAKIDRQDLRRRLIAAEQINRQLVDDNTRLDIDVAADEIIGGGVNIAAAETDEGDDLDRLVMACILSEGRWWVEFELTGCTTEAELAGWVMDRAGDTCTEEQALKVIDELSRLGFFICDEDDEFLLRKMSDDKWFSVTADILATWEQVINRGAK